MNTIEKIRDIMESLEGLQPDEERAATVKAYWEIGKLVEEYQDSTGLLQREIAKETGIARHNIQKYAQFYRTFKNGYPKEYYGKVINWTHINLVMPIKGAEKRDFYLKEACRNGWNKVEFYNRVKNDFFSTVQEAKAQNKKLEIKRKNGRLYTYSAEVVRVIDGDTLEVEIDAGFGMRMETRIRLRDINCPEIGTKKGEAAKEFVINELNKCIVQKPIFKGSLATRPMVVVKTYKLGLYGRYSGDIYYLPGENNPEVVASEGKLLNQVLLDEGHAQKA